MHRFLNYCGGWRVTLANDPDHKNVKYLPSQLRNLVIVGKMSPVLVAHLIHGSLLCISPFSVTQFPHSYRSPTFPSMSKQLQCKVACISQGIANIDSSSKQSCVFLLYPGNLVATIPLRFSKHIAKWPQALLHPFNHGDLHSGNIRINAKLHLETYQKTIKTISMFNFISLAGCLHEQNHNFRAKP